MKDAADSHPQLDKLPRHVAIIMDGNNRWAKARKLPGVAGHKAGVESVRAVIEVALRQGIEALTLFAFSSENWKRPQEEVNSLMELFTWVLKREVKRLNKYEVRLKVIGDRSAFSSDLQKLMARAEAKTADNQRMTLIIAANYGGRWDLLQATQKLAAQAAAGALDPASLTEEQLAAELSLKDYPDPDLCIRTSGEQRISNFLLWQLAYAELVFAREHWPDFRQDAFFATLQDYAQRQRRFGGRAATPSTKE
ncbi:polyprenyl diphosphate synthase [Marinospirillum sp.]|uniref:polyprenyl diphosphate synthase n=1 Tax=Marinospirillum sp. TaxID=2183934 RepID=UPI0028706A98|nr:polyprenyl diphosphate synthase [Marinospirillum sp.]MDR9468834.1 polyprenyl diphosphate synthase [Marinospirillum sp.]